MACPAGTRISARRSARPERAAESFDRGLNPPGVARQLAAIAASGNRKDALSAVHVPALVIHGDVDPLVPLAGGVATANAIPGAKLVVIKGMGHALPIPCGRRSSRQFSQHAK
jgi:pimeloyl-ACP methyl ester carboxylesterase